jgi:hypothetical protein
MTQEMVCPSKIILSPEVNFCAAVPLHRKLEQGLDDCKFVIVPVDSEMTGTDLQWQIVVTDKAILPFTVVGTTTWTTTWKVSSVSAISRRVKSNKVT